MPSGSNSHDGYTVLQGLQDPTLQFNRKYRPTIFDERICEKVILRNDEYDLRILFAVQVKKNIKILMVYFTIAAHRK